MKAGKQEVTWCVEWKAQALRDIIYSSQMYIAYEKSTVQLGIVKSGQYEHIQVELYSLQHSLLLAQ